MEFRFRLYYQLTKILRCSHKEAIHSCRSGLVQVDGQVMTDPRIPIGIYEEIRLSGRVIRKGVELKYVLFYKPNLYECTTNRSIENNMYEVFPPEYQDLFSLGRLDINSEGLLLLTNDGKRYKEMMGEEANLEKEYVVFTYSPVTDELKSAFTQPFQLGKRMTLPADFEKVDEFCFKVVLKEGINRQIRRICAKNNNQVKQLIRIRFGNQLLGDLKTGEFIEVSGFQ